MKKIFYPILLALAVVLGIEIGVKLDRNNQSKIGFGNDDDGNGPSEKLSTLFDLIDSQYVDTVNTDSLSDVAIENLLTDLDPHSVYLPASELKMANDDLNGSFSGIGVQFSIEHDSIIISNVISGGPCKKKGVRAGDRIVSANGKKLTGKNITNDMVIKTLRGKKGSKVKLGICRSGVKGVLTFDIIRDDISVSSIDASYMIAPKTGYVRVNKFGESTYEEFMSSLNSLKKSGATSYIIDLRDNSGGYLESGIRMINEFLKKGQLIVYTQGRDGRQNSYADGTGTYQNVPLTVLIDEWSASAAEIFAGAMQDNDRAVIIGRRSFGKGLVQQQYQLTDSSAVRLTIARYYTPAGRCIQKPYKNEQTYTDEILRRYESGEMEDPTKYTHNKKEKKFKTKNGRTVYGGGGITPDLFVGIEKMNSYFKQLANESLYDFAFSYTDKNRAKLSSFKTLNELKNYLDGQHLDEQLAVYAFKTKKIRKNPSMMGQNYELIRTRIEACIARNFFGDKGYFDIMNRNDATVKQALKGNNQYLLSGKNLEKKR